MGTGRPTTADAAKDVDAIKNVSWFKKNIEDPINEKVIKEHISKVFV
jgi:hypothetical protein